MYSKGLIETFQLIMLVCFYESDGVWLQSNLTAGMCFLYITQKGLIFYKLASREDYDSRCIYTKPQC